MRRKNGMPRSLPFYEFLPEWMIQWQELRPGYWQATVCAPGEDPFAFYGRDQDKIRRDIKAYKTEHYRPKPITEERI